VAAAPIRRRYRSTSQRAAAVDVQIQSSILTALADDGPSRSRHRRRRITFTFSRATLRQSTPQSCRLARTDRNRFGARVSCGDYKAVSGWRKWRLIAARTVTVSVTKLIID